MSKGLISNDDGTEFWRSEMDVQFGFMAGQGMSHAIFINYGMTVEREMHYQCNEFVPSLCGL